MEWIAGAVLGALVGEWLLGKRLGNRAVAWGAVAGLLPGVFMVVPIFMDTAGWMWWHRGPGYSAVAAVAGGLLLARPLSRFWKREKITAVRAGCFISAVWLARILLACLDTAGAAVWWPFAGGRVSFGIVEAGDPLLALPPAACLVWMMFYRTKKQRPKRLRAFVWGCGLLACYAGFTAVMKLTAATGFATDLEERGAGADRRVVVPEAPGGLVWRAVVDRGDELWMGRRTIFQRWSAPVSWVVYPRGAGEDAEHAGEREVRRVREASDGYWIARAHNRGLWMADLRQGEMRETGNRDAMEDLRMAVAWDFEAGAPRDRLIRAGEGRPGFAAATREVALRITGREDDEKLTPRLAGVPGQFPEILRVVE